MAENGRSGASQDPLERYRQALRRQSAGLEPSPVVAETPPPVAQPASDEPLELDEPLAEEEPLGLDEPLAAEEPLDLGEPLAEEEPLGLDEPLAEEAPLELDEPLAAEEPLELGEPLDLGEPLAAAESSGSGEARTAAAWLGLDDAHAEEDPLGLDDPHSLEAAPQTAADPDPGVAAADDDVPEELQGTLARYQMAMSKLRSQKAADTPDPLADQGGSTETTEVEGGDAILRRFQQARSRQQDLEGGAPESATTRSISREASDRLSEVRTARSETEDADELVRDFPTRAKVTRKSRQRSRPVSRAALGWSTRAVTFAALLFAALPVQWLVYRQLGASFALEDLGAGLSALLPAALILLLARPASGKGQIVMVLGSAAVGLIGSAGFAYGFSLLQSQLPQGTSLVFGLLLSLGLFTAVWGPLFLILVPVLSRMSPPARGNL